jgi:hypothetical protein
VGRLVVLDDAAVAVMKIKRCTAAEGKAGVAHGVGIKSPVLMPDVKLPSPKTPAVAANGG